MDRARAEAELADPEKAKDADELATKTLLEQILLKMKNLREELSKNSTLRDALVSGLGETGPTPTPTPSPSPNPNQDLDTLTELLDQGVDPNPNPNHITLTLTLTRILTLIPALPTRWTPSRRGGGPQP